MKTRQIGIEEGKVSYFLWYFFFFFWNCLKIGRLDVIWWRVNIYSKVKVNFPILYHWNPYWPVLASNQTPILYQKCQFVFYQPAMSLLYRVNLCSRAKFMIRIQQCYMLCCNSTIFIMSPRWHQVTRNK